MIQIREFHYESGKKSGNSVIVFICYFLMISKINRSRPRRSDIKYMYGLLLDTMLEWASINLESGKS